MYGGRFLRILTLGLMFFLLVSCGRAFSVDDLQGAIADGVIIPPGGESTWETNFELVTATRRDITRTVDLVPTARFPVLHPLSFERYGGVYNGAYIAEQFIMVQEGDVLASQSFRDIQTLETGIRLVNRQRLLFQIEEFENEFIRENNALNSEIAALRGAASGSPRLTSLRIESLRLQQERFQFESELTRQNLEAQLYNLREEADEERIYAPIDGIITFISPWHTSMLTEANHVFFYIADQRFIQFHVQAVPEMLRFGTTHIMRDIDSTFEIEVRVANDPFAFDGHGQIIDFIFVPDDMEALDMAMAEYGLTILDVFNMDFRITVEETLVHGGVVIPTRGIRPEDRADYVLIYNDGRLAKRYITRGFSHMGYTQVLTGLSEGQKVALP